jgi:hypothetical protein
MMSDLWKLSQIFVRDKFKPNIRHCLTIQGCYDRQEHRRSFYWVGVGKTDEKNNMLSYCGQKIYCRVSCYDGSLINDFDIVCMYEAATGVGI